MPIFYFDVDNGMVQEDVFGTECANLNEVQTTVIRSLPRIVADEISGSEDRFTFSIIVRDSERRPVYTATLKIDGKVIDGEK